MDDQFKHLNYKRSSCKTRLTLFKRFVDELVNDSDPTKLNELEMRVNRFENLINEFDNVQLQLECFDGESEANIKERAIFENAYFSVLATAKGLLQNFTVKDEFDNQSIRSSQSEHSVSETVHYNTIKLPIINMPKFGGNYDRWLEFRDTYKSLIHSNDNLNAFQKYHYLRSSLEEDAARVIESLSLSENNYSA